MEGYLTCVDRVMVRDRAVTYRLADQSGEIKDYTREEVYDMLLNGVIYISNLRLTQNNRIILLTKGIQSEDSKKDAMSENDADQVQKNLIGIMLNYIKIHLQCSPSCWKADEIRDSRHVDKVYYIYTGRKISAKSQVGQYIINRNIDDNLYSGSNNKKELDLCITVTMQYDIDRVNSNKVYNISTSASIVIPGSIEPVELSNGPVSVSIDNICHIRSIYISSKLRTLLQYLGK